MYLTHWLANFRTNVTRKLTKSLGKSRRLRNVSQVTEALEDRALLAAYTVTFNDPATDALTVTGTTGADTLSVIGNGIGTEYTFTRQAGDTFIVPANADGIVYSVAGTVLTVTIATQTNLDRIVINLGDGNDQLIVAGITDGLTVDGGADSDTITVNGTGINTSGQTVTAVSLIAETITVSSVVNTGTGALTLSGTSGLDANLTAATLNIHGAATQTAGNIVVSGTTTINAGSTSDVFLDGPLNSNAFATVAITSARDVTLRDINAIALGASTVSGNLSVATTNGAITDTGDLSVSGTATFRADGSGANGDITLNNSNNFSVVSIGAARNVTLNDSDSLIFGASTISGTLAVTTAGAITQSGILNVTGVATFAAGAANDITLNTHNNLLSTVTITSGKDVAIKDTVAGLILGASTISGTLDVEADGAITQTGNTTVADVATFVAGAANNITLSSTGNDFSTVVITSGDNVSLRDANAIDLGASTVSGTLAVTAAGAITQSGILDIGGVATFVAGAANDITLDTHNNLFSTVATTSGKDVRLRDVNGGLILGASTVSGDLTVTSTGGDITDSGNVIVTGVATFVAGANHIDLDSTGNNFSTVVITSGQNVTLRDTNAIILGASTVTGDLAITAGATTGQSVDFGTVTVGGALHVTTPSGNVTQSGALNVTGTTTFVAGTTRDITLGNPGNQFSTVVITSGRNVTLNDVDAIELGASTVSGALTATTGGAISQAGNLTVTGVATFAAGAANDITLGGTNNFSTVSIVSGDDVTLNDTNAIILGTSTVSGTLTVTAVGAITDSGNLTVTGAASFTTTGGTSDITLNDNNTYNDTVTINSARDLALSNSTFAGDVSITSARNAIVASSAGGISLGTSTTTGTLAVTTAGAITQSGILNVTGVATFAAGAANDITLNTHNNLLSTVTITSGKDVAIKDTVAGLILGASTISGTLDVEADGAITQTGNTTVADVATFVAGAANNITLSSTGNDFSTVVITSGDNVNLRDANAIDLGASTASGNFTLIAGGNVTQSGVLIINGTGASSITATGFDITLDNGANEFGGAGGNIDVAGATVWLRDDSGFAISSPLVSTELVLESAGPITQTSIITGTGGLTKKGSGTLTLSQTNTYGGSTTIEAGTVEIVRATAGAAAVIPDASVVEIALGATLAFGTNASSESIGGLSGAGSVTKLAGAGLSTLTVNVSGTEAFSGSIDNGTGTVALTKSGVGTQSLSGVNTYTGTTNVSAGTLRLTGGNDRLSTGSSLLVSGTAVFDVGANSQSFVAVQLTNGTLDGTGTITSTNEFDLRSGTVNAVLAGANGATKSGVGTVTLNAVNTYTGTTAVDAGTLELGGHDRLNSAGSLVVSVGTVNFAGYNQTLAAVTLTSGTIDGTGTLTSASNFALADGTVNVNLSGSVGANKTGSGSNIVTLNGNNTYSGNTTVTGGHLIVNGSLSATSDVTIPNSSSIRGTGTIPGTVTLTGVSADVHPGTDSLTGTLTIGTLVMNNLTDLNIQVNGNGVGQHDQVVVTTGGVTLTNVDLFFTGSTIASSPGQIITILDKQSAGAISGTFNGLPEASTVNINGTNFVISYFGGDGNDVVLAQAGQVVFDATAGADNLELRLEGVYFQIIDLANGNAILEQRLAITVTEWVINGLDGDDTLTVNYGGTGGFFNTPITFNGQGQTNSPNGDELVITGSSVNTITHTFTNANDGSVNLDGTIITYTGLEPVIDNMAAVNRIFTFNGGAETITLTDAAGANMTIDSTLGESVTFANPTGSLTINAGTGNDIININSVDAAFNVDLTINGDAADDTVNLNSAITFAAGESLIVNAETFNTGAAGAATVSGAGTITITADNVELNATSALTAAGTVTIQPQSANRTIRLGSNTGTSLNLTDDELNRITASRLIIGNSSAGTILIASDIAPAGVTTLRLNSNANVDGTAGGITVPNLAVEVATLAVFSAVNDVNNLAGDINTFIDSDGFTVTTVDGLSGISSNPTILTANTGDITIDSPVTSQTATITALAGNVVVNSTVTGTDVLVVSETGNVTVNGTVTSSNTLAITLNGNNGLLNLAGTGLIELTAGLTVTLSADKMILDGLVIALTRTVILQNGNGADAIDLGSTTDAAANTLELSDAELDRITAGLIRVGSGTMGAVTVSDVINTLSTNNLHIITGAGVSQSGVGSIIESTLAITAGGAVAMATNNNELAMLAITTTTGNIAFAENNGLNIGTVDGVNGVSTAGGNVTITLQAGDLTVINTAAIDDVLATTGITLTVQGNDASVVINTSANMNTSGGDVLITADEMHINGTITAAGGTQIVTLQPQNASEAIVLGGNPGVANTLELSDAELDRIAAGNVLRIGRSNAGNITFTGSISPAGATVLHLITGAAIVDNNATNPDITVTNLAINSATGIGATGTNSAGGLEINVTNLAFQNTTSGNVQFTEAAGGLGYTINSVDGLATSFNQGVGTTTLNANSPITFAVNTSSGGTLTANAVEAGPGTPDTDNITVNQTIVVESTAGDVIFNAGDRITLAGTNVGNRSTVRSVTGNVTLNSGVGDADNDGRQTLNALIEAASGTITVNLNDEGGLTQQANGGRFNAPNLLLLGTGAGTIDFAQSSANTVGTLAASTGGTIGYRDLDALIVGTVGATNGVVTTNDDVLIRAGGTVTINQQFNTGTGDIRLNLTAGGVTQAAAGVVTANELGILAIDAVTLGAVANNVTVLAVQTTTSGTGSVVFREADSVTIGTVSSVTGFPGATGITTTNSDVLVHANTSIVVNQAIAVGTADVRLITNTGSVTQNGTGAITADELGVRAGSFISLAAASNDVTEFAAAATGTLEFSDINSFTVGTVAAQTSGVAVFTNTPGVHSNNGDIALLAVNNIVIDEDITSGTGDVLLSSGGTVTQTAGSDVTGTGLIMLGLLATPTTGGTYTLTNTGNNFTTIAGQTGSTIHYVDANAIIVGTVVVDTVNTDVTRSGISTTNDDVTLRAITGSITINQAINLGAEATGGDLELILNDNASASVTQGVAGNVLGHGIALLGTGTGPYQFTLDNIGNDFLNIAADFSTGVAAFALRYQDASDLHVNVVTGLTTTTTGITTGNPAVGGGVRLRAGQTNPNGILYIDNDINTNNGTGGNLTIGGGVIFTAGNTFNGAGDIDLEGGANSPDIIVDVAATHNMTGGTVTYRPDRDIFINRPVTVNNGHLVLDADGEDPIINQTIANTSANLGTGNGIGGLWIRDQGSVDVNSGGLGGGSLIMAGSQINNTPNGGPAYVAPTALVAGAGIQIDNTTAANEVTAATTISALVKTITGLGSASNDMQVDGIIQGDSFGQMNVQVEDTLTLNGTIAQTSAGNIFIDAEDMVINTTTAIIDARPAGFVHLRNRTAGRQIDIGTNTAGQLSLTDAELDRIAQATAVRIGRRTTAGSGNINITAGPIDLANNTTLHLISGAQIVDTAAGHIVETNLALEAASHITLNTGTDDNTANDHDVQNLAMATFNAGADAAFYDRNGFTIANVDGINGIQVNDVASLYSGVETTQPGDVVQTAPVVADELQLLGQGTYNLVGAANDVNFLAANVLNSVNYIDVDDVTVTTVTNPQLGITTDGTSSASIVLTAARVNVDVHMITTSELGFIVFDVTGVGFGGVGLNINGVVGGGALVDPIIDSKGFVQQYGVGTVELQGTILTTNDNVGFSSAVQLTANTVINTGTGAGNITFSSNLRGSTPGATPTFENLTLTAGTGNILFNGPVGLGGFPLGVVTIHSAQDVTANSIFLAREVLQVSGTGETRFNGLLQTNQPNGVNLTGNFITFNGPVQTLNNGVVIVNNAGDFTIVAGAGSVNADGAFSQTGIGNSLIGGDIVTTDDNIMFADDVYLTNTPILMNAGTADISFAQRLQLNNKTLTVRDGDDIELGTITTLAGGTLTSFVGNTAVRNTVTVGNGELLTGAGTLNTHLSVLTGGQLAPALDGSALGTGILTINGNTTLGANSVLSLELNGAFPGTGYDQIVTGSGFAFTINPATILQLANYATFNPANGTVLRIVDHLGVTPNAGTFAGMTNGSNIYVNGFYYRIDYNSPAGDITLTRVASPVTETIMDDVAGAYPAVIPGVGTFNLINGAPTDAWSINSVVGVGYQNDLRFNTAGTGASQAVWTFTGLTAGTTYRISATWRSHANRATNSPFTITGGAAAVNVAINQRNQPDDFTASGVTWEDLSTSYTITGTTLTITLTDAANGYVIADAIRIETTSAAAPEVKVEDTTLVVLPAAGVDIEDNNGEVDFGTIAQGGPNVDRQITVRNTGYSTLTLGSGSIAAPAGFQVIGYSATTVAPGAYVSFTVRLLSTNAGNFSGQIAFNTNDLNENPFNFTVKGAVIANGVTIVDNARDPAPTGNGFANVIGPGYAESGAAGWHNNDDFNVGYLNDIRYATANSNATATWTFNGLTPNSLYRVSTTWNTHSNRANNAAYTVSDGITTVNLGVNQRIQPNDLLSASIWWEDLVSSFFVGASGTLTISLTALGSNGFVIADAVRIESLPPLMAADGELQTLVAVPSVTADELAVLAEEAVNRWNSTMLTPEQRALLANLSFTITDLPDAFLGAESESTIFVDINAAGHGWYLDSTPTDDVEFGKYVAGSEFAATELDAAFGMDLLTVLMHEIGHRLGADDLDPAVAPHDLMTGTLSSGLRRLPTVAAEAEVPVVEVETECPPADLDLIFVDINEIDEAVVQQTSPVITGVSSGRADRSETRTEGTSSTGNSSTTSSRKHGKRSSSGDDASGWNGFKPRKKK